MSKSFRVEFRVLAFTQDDQETAAVSPERIEKRMMEALRSIILDEVNQDTDHDHPVQVFGYVHDMSVTKNDPV